MFCLATAIPRAVEGSLLIDLLRIVGSVLIVIHDDSLQTKGVFILVQRRATDKHLIFQIFANFRVLG